MCNGCWDLKLDICAYICLSLHLNIIACMCQLNTFLFHLSTASLERECSLCELVHMAMYVI